MVITRVVYWAIVLAISLVLVFLLIRFLESRDEPQFEQSVGPSLVRPGSSPEGGSRLASVGHMELKAGRRA